MAQYPKIESTSSIGSIILAILEVDGHGFGLIPDISAPRPLGRLKEPGGGFRSHGSKSHGSCSTRQG